VTMSRSEVDAMIGRKRPRPAPAEVNTTKRGGAQLPGATKGSHDDDD